MDFSFLDLRCKEVINVVDGRCLGHITDIIFSMSSGIVAGFVVPATKNFWSVFKNAGEIFIPLSQVRKIGDDTILVELFGASNPSGNIYSTNTATSIQGPSPKNGQKY